MNLYEQPEIFTTGRKSIHLEYHKPDKSYLEFEVFHGKIVEMQVMKTDYDNAKFWELSCNDIDHIREIVENFLYA